MDGYKEREGGKGQDENEQKRTGRQTDRLGVRKRKGQRGRKRSEQTDRQT
jgi:hypothetical protein